MKNKKQIYLTGLLILATIFTSYSQSNQTKNPFTNKKDSLSYSFGVLMGSNFVQQGVDLNPDLIVNGLLAAINKKPTLLQPETCQEIVSSFFTELQKKAEMENAKALQENKAKGDQFLAENKTKEGVKTTASGLQYKIIQPGNSQKPTADSTVLVHYKGTLLDGKEFDSSYGRGEPIKFKLSQVIPGWTEGVQLMGIGGKFIFYIPSQLAYGERGAGNVIPPNSALIFEVELLDIIK